MMIPDDKDSEKNSPEDILVVEDTRTNLEFLVHILRNAGYRVRPASNGELALRSAQVTAPALILLDILLPGIDGYEVCRQLKANEKTSSIPIIFISALNEEKEKIKGFQVGGVDYITKPFDSEEVLARVNTHLTLQRMQLQATAHNNQLRIANDALLEQTEELALINQALETEIAQRKQVEKVLRESEGRYRRLTENAPDIIFRYNIIPKMSLAYINPTVQIITGYSPEEFYADPNLIMRMVHPEDVGQMTSLLQGLMPSGEPIVMRWTCKDGITRWTESRMLAVYNVEGHLEAVECITRDITEAKQLEEAKALRASMEKFQLVIQNTRDLIFVVDPSYRLITFNGHYQDIIQLSEEREPVAGDFVLQPIYPQEVLGLWKSCYDRAFSGESFSLETEVAFMGDGEHTFDNIFSPFRDSDSKIIGALVVSHDITERKQFEEQMLVTEKLAGLGTLAAGIAHELNSPLQVITGSSEGALRRIGEGVVEPELLTHYFEAIERNGWRCAEIVRSLLSYAHLTSGKRKKYNLNEIVHDTLLLTQHQLEKWSNITITTQLAPDMPPLVCDQNQIIQVLINLLTNARDAMPDGGEIFIQTSYDTSARQIILQVSDSGPGITAAAAKKIFDPFFTTKPIGQGTGLGLYIVASIIHALGGEIKLGENTPRGAIFTIFFPEDENVLPSKMPDETGERYLG